MHSTLADPLTHPTVITQGGALAPLRITGSTCRGARTVRSGSVLLKIGNKSASSSLSCTRSVTCFRENESESWDLAETDIGVKAERVSDDK
jgi:hypothetical protein